MPSGMVLVDKPSNTTSGELVRRIERIFGEKAGHTGILDPKVSGLMLILVGKARKLAKFFFGMDKEYEGIMHIHREFEERELRKVVKEFEGEIIQLPPRRSKVARVPRKRKIHYFRILKIAGRDVYFKVKCEAGTYIRKICHDIGKKMGKGAHMKWLRRLKVGEFSVEEAVELEKLENSANPKKYLIPLEKIPEILKFSIAEIGEEETFRRAKNGVPLKTEEIAIKKRVNNKPIAVYYKNRLVGIAMEMEGRLRWDCVLAD